MSGTYGDIRARFAAALNKAVNESKSGGESELLNTLRPAFDKAGYDGKIESGRRPKHLRYMLGKNVNDTLASINAVLKRELSNYTIDTISPGDYKSGSFSGKYYTFNIILQDSTIVKGVEFPAGIEFKIVNDDVPAGSISAKALTPVGLGLPSTYMNQQQIISVTKNAVSSKYKDDDLIIELLHSLVNDVAGFSSKHRYESAGNVDTFEETITYSPNTSHLISHFDPSDLNTIGKDFGEILGAIYMLNICGYNKGIEFPSGNNPLVDFYIDGFGVSSKYKSGAAPTLSGIIKNVNQDQLTTDAEKDLLEVFKIVESSKVSEGYLKIAKHFNMPGYQALVEITRQTDITIQSLNTFIQQILSEKPEEFMNIFDKFYTTIGRFPQGKKIEWNRIKAEKVYGAVIGPISYHVTDFLNANGQIKDALTNLLSKLEVKQLYLDFIPKRNEIHLHMKSFSTEGVKFTFEAPNQSVYVPDNGKLGFKMK